ncbi:MAG: 4Fe-4S dicluster domain-containing protein [Candidatus Wallbacteria bacterium]|nr:4Fe-4S dicluster domain-containing protein [Candidatus Wallbacteria bacterium]
MSSVTIDQQICKGCELCCKACPQGVLAPSKRINPKGYYPAEVADGSRCIACRLCAVVCPDVAIQIHVHGVSYDFFRF